MGSSGAAAGVYVLNVASPTTMSNVSLPGAVLSRGCGFRKTPTVCIFSRPLRREEQNKSVFTVGSVEPGDGRTDFRVDREADG